jgi:hypothetical protein
MGIKSLPSEAFSGSLSLHQNLQENVQTCVFFASGALLDLHGVQKRSRKLSYRNDSGDSVFFASVFARLPSVQKGYTMIDVPPDTHLKAGHDKLIEYGKRQRKAFEVEY